jgi:hypothetical protein
VTGTPRINTPAVVSDANRPSNSIIKRILSGGFKGASSFVKGPSVRPPPTPSHLPR